MQLMGLMVVKIEVAGKLSWQAWQNHSGRATHRASPRMQHIYNRVYMQVVTSSSWRVLCRQALGAGVAGMAGQFSLGIHNEGQLAHGIYRGVCAYR